MPAKELAEVGPETLAGVDLVITMYGSVPRLAWLGTTEWDLVVLDEAKILSIIP